MFMKKFFLKPLKKINEFFARQQVRRFKEKSSLISFFIHGLFIDQNEIAQNLVDPMEKMTIQHLRQFIEYFQSNGYTFISPDDILSGLDPAGYHALLTFDDGYFNNFRAVPILNEYRVPAVFFISSKYILNNTCFWWDVLYRESVKAGLTQEQIYRETARLKSFTVDKIELQLKKSFGADAFLPKSDLDRPFNVSELKEFASNKYVHIGNHTHDHAILTNYPADQIADEIEVCQNTLFNIIGKYPVAISYPNGNFSNEIIKISKDKGLKLGLTVIPEKNPLPLRPERLMRLTRFGLSGKSELIRQCELFRTDLHLARKIRNKLNKHSY
jgi:peptidoglycan/xylan/chitin deacetylase (PgdA/CDA1 family)